MGCANQRSSTQRALRMPIREPPAQSMRSDVHGARDVPLTRPAPLRDLAREPHGTKPATGPAMISGLVLMLSTTKDGDAQLHTWLADDKRLDVGVIAGRCLPVVAATSSVKESRDLVDELSAHPSVNLVHVVNVSFEQESN